MTPIQVVIFTDMDGSLLDHETYSHVHADKMLAWLRSNQVPVVPCTSKTRAEMEVLRIEMNNQHPFIVENGAAIYMPADYFCTRDEKLNKIAQYQVKEFTHTRGYWQTVLSQVPLHLNDAFISFQKAGVKGIMHMTGLTEDKSRLASQRGYSEPIKWLGSEQQFKQFEKYIQSNSGNLLKGGRFVHVSGECDKGKSLLWLVEKYKVEYPHQKIVSIALGDSHNDVAMLNAADYAVVIRSPTHECPHIYDKQVNRVYYTQSQGPKGWTEGLLHVLSTLGFKNITL